MVAETQSMEEKKTPPSASAKEKAKDRQAAKLVDFFAGIKGELKKITWTPKEEVWFIQKLSLQQQFFLGLSIYFVDVVIQSLLQALRIVVHFLGM